MRIRKVMVNPMRNWIKWGKAAAIRAAKTFAQTTVALLPASAMITDVDWKVVVGTAALAAVASLLTSLAGSPEEDLYGQLRPGVTLLWRLFS